MCEFEFRRGRTNNMLAQQIILDLLPFWYFETISLYSSDIRCPTKDC